MSKAMKILLSITIIALIMALWVGCASTTSSSTLGNSQPSSSSTQNKPDSTEQQTSNPSNTQQSQPGDRPAGGDNSLMNEVAIRAAEILNISEDEFLTAFETAMSTYMPEAPDQSGQQPPQGEPPESMDEPPQEPPELPEGKAPDMQPGQIGGHGPGFDRQEIYAEMAGILGISADDIASAFEQAQQELGS